MRRSCDPLARLLVAAPSLAAPLLANAPNCVVRAR